MTITNLEMKVENNKLHITVDLAQNFGRSKRGRSDVVASSGGFVSVDDSNGISLNMNVNKKI